MADMVDAAEHYLDQRGLDRPHVVGNSMGGYIAIELARRGRAATVCALSPAGFWSAGDGLQTEAFKAVDKNRASGRRFRPFAPLLLKSFGERVADPTAEPPAVPGHYRLV